ncbi:TIP-1 family-domain-containing protein [Lipomyces arxii]|uniref:TIP-1 family-domain-containing protein n=1 Tax=Lipomyces arxii TaxID=56418 RepID=UPI0034CFBDCE
MSIVSDYINKVLPSVADLDKLDDLVANLEDEQGKLSTKIDEIQSRISTEKDALLDDSYRILNQFSAFRSSYGKVKDKLINASYRTQPKFLSELQTLTTKLDKVQLGREYFRVVEDVYRICDNAKNQVSEYPVLALESLKELQRVHEHVASRNTEAENAVVYLLQFLVASMTSLQVQLRDVLANDFRSTLEVIGWPRRISQAADMTSFETSMNKLLSFQISLGTTKKTTSVPLIPFEVMAEPLDIRFRFHFEGNKETNRIDRPEWMFTHFIATIEDCRGFVEFAVQEILDRLTVVSNRVALNELILAYLPSVERKIKLLIPIVKSDPQLFSHLMLETMKFDDYLRDAYNFTPYGQDEWEGVTGVVMTKSQFFESWITVEKNFAFDRYQDIIAAADAWVIDFDAVGETETKPTKSAIRLRDLLETIIERYRPLKSFVHRIRFLMDIQIAILDSYHNRISASLDAFENLSSSIVRAVSGVAEEERKKMVYGFAGIERLCRAYGSANTIRDALRDWGDDLFFLELYDELNRLASKNKKSGEEIWHIGANLPNVNEDDGTIFDEIISAYDALRDRTEKLIIKHLQREVQKAYKTESAFKQAVKAKEVVSVELLKKSTIMTEMINYLAKALSQTSFDYVSMELYRSLHF